jgi:hypothetical protein
VSGISEEAQNIDPERGLGIKEKVKEAPSTTCIC